jgi:phosphatidylglycerophosphate synthase
VRDRADLAFKAYEIEELADVYFFRPAGMVVARVAWAAGLSPTALTVIGALVGAMAGALLFDDAYAVAAFALLILHSILDSSDGQLARATGRTSELGRVLDGASGYVTHAAIYGAILVRIAVHGEGAGYVAVTLAAAAANVVHAQLYDYFRGSYTAIAIRGQTQPPASSQAASRILDGYRALQRSIAGMHEDVERAISVRSSGGVVRADDRERYRRFFYWPVRGWNLLGDNTRIYAVGILAVTAHIEWFPWVVLVPMNAACAALWIWQARADRRFLAGL